MTNTDPCFTPGCPGDGRYSAPGRGHVEGCRHPVPPTDPAVTAAAEALWVTEHFPVDENDMRLPSRDHPDFVQMEVMTYASAENAVAAARPIIEAEVRRSLLWECPDCAFGFDRAHADEGGGYSCPLCELAEVRERIAAEIEAEAASLRATEQPDYIRAALDLEVAARIARGTA